MMFPRFVGAAIALLSITSCASSHTQSKPATPPKPFVEAQAVVAAEDRSTEDRALDESRQPIALLQFMELRQGARVAELGAGDGYTTELLARAVGSEGKVFAQNPAMVIEKFVKEKWPTRLAKPVNAHVVRVDREFDDPLPPEANNLDAVVMNLFYHDLYWFGTDRAAMNRAVLRALKPGGVFVVIDHSGREGSGTSEVKTLHRIEESVVRDDVTAAGFKFAGSGNFLRNPQDARDWMVFSENRRGTTDRFVLKFVKR